MRLALEVLDFTSVAEVVENLHVLSAQVRVLGVFIAPREVDDDHLRLSLAVREWGQVEGRQSPGNTRATSIED